MTLMLCATTSCSSLAIRRRSSATALLAASSWRPIAYPAALPDDIADGPGDDHTEHGRDQQNIQGGAWPAGERVARCSATFSNSLSMMSVMTTAPRTLVAVCFRS